MTDISHRIASLSPEKRALLEARLLRERTAASPVPAIGKRPDTGPAPLSFAQQRLWFLDQLEPGQAHYNLPLALRLTGELDVAALSRALDAIVRRHEALRTTFASRNGKPHQVIGAAPRVPVERRDLSILPEGDRAPALRRLMADELARPFDLSRDGMLRAALIRESDGSQVLLLMMHHIAADGWSIGILLEELAALYRAGRSGAEAALPPLPIQYADYAVWQREWLQGGVEEKQIGYWRQRLSGELPLLAMPTDRPRPVQQTFSGAQERRTMTRSLADKLETLSRESGATMFMTLLAGFAVLLSRLSGQEDILIGTPMAGRNRVETEDLIGFFVNTLVLRVDLTGDPTFRELLGRVRERSLEAYAHQDLPFERLVEELQPERDLAHSPLFQVMFAFENYPIGYPTLPGLGLESVEFDTIVSNFDLTLDMALNEMGLAGSLEYNSDLFERSTAGRWLANLEILLEGIAAAPDRRLSELPILTESERERLLVTWNATAADFPSDRCLHELFESQAARQPDAVAAEANGDRLTYGQLEARANALARRLRELGVGPDVPVGICLERSLSAAVTLLGVLKAGGAYVPLDPSYPAVRLKFFLEDSGAPVLVTERRFAHLAGEGAWKTVLVDSLPADDRGGPTPASRVTPDHLAYIIYTSGSTGRPKGVMIPHRAVVNHACAIRRRFHLGPSDRVLQFAALSFDVAAEEIFPTLAAGATVLFRSGEVIGPAEFGALLEAQQPTVVNLPSGFWHEWVAELERSGRPLPPSLRLVVAGSERVLTERLEWWRRHVAEGVVWLNGYGPTEATITATLYEPAGGDLPFASVPIGRPIANVKLYVVDAHGRLCPIGAAGELWIGGAGLARGYRGDPERTAEKFIPDPFGAPGDRLYRTGDQVRYLADGNLEFLGRLDGQIKIRGFRIELGEIESAIEQHPGIREAAVVGRDEGAAARLVAYFVPAATGSVDADQLKTFLKERLPGYMIPSALVLLETLPRTGSGKVDRARLPEPGRPREDAEDHVAPRTPIEQTVAAIWGELLRVDHVGAKDNFFDLGGHSLLATQVVSRFRDAFGIEIPLRALFESPTVEELSLAIAQSQAERAAPDDLARLLEELEKETPRPVPGGTPASGK